jgi:segregation and condensation protein A
MTIPSEFAVDLPVFSGPFRLLSELILEQRMDVCDVPVARITDAFIRSGSDRLGRWSLEEASWFLAVCAVMLELKVGRLLPRPALESEEDLLGGASPDLVYARSLELAAFRTVALDLTERMESAALMVPRTAGPPAEFAHLYPDVLETVTAESLRAIAAAVLAPAPDLDLSHITPIRASLAEALRAVEDRLMVRPESRFRDLVEECRDRIEVVVRFLALLELYREGKVELSQATVFGEIEVTWQASTGGGTGTRGADEGQAHGIRPVSSSSQDHRVGEAAPSGGPGVERRSPPGSVHPQRGGDVE